jgi:hypothetical protein
MDADPIPTFGGSSSNFASEYGLRISALRVQLSAPLCKISVPHAGTSTVGELERLAELHRTGALSDQEFAALKEKLISGLQ